jgi:hypothetical protein
MSTPKAEELAAIALMELLTEFNMLRMRLSDQAVAAEFFERYKHIPNMGFANELTFIRGLMVEVREQLDQQENAR